MKTKHLFLATALMASFAACTNEEIVSDVQQNVATGRPTVENVILDFGMNADSRVSYDGGYKWNSTDVIGALLMDQPNGLPSSAGWADKTWDEKYNLTSTIHTSYPFAYADGEWSCNTKMLEGNYFFAWPWESYDGNRQVLHSLIDQKQTGVEKDVRPVSYAENQFFIGYQRIMAGTEAQDVLNKVEMWPVLGGIQLQIVNTGTQTYHINKVVLSSNQLNSTLTFNPVCSADGGYNYSELKDENFNYANYLELKDEKYYSKNATEDYSREEALLAVVAPVANENADGFVQLLIEGEEDERALEAEAGNTAYVMIMANPVAKVTDLKLAIYTDEGIVSNIDLTKINKEIDAEKGASAITSAKVKAIGPNVTNTIKVQIDDNSFYTPTEINVYNENDLLQFIQWNVEEVGAREIVATIEKDVTFTEEMYDLLKGNKNITLGLVSENNTMTLDAELPANFLDDEQIVFASEFKNKADEDEEPEYDFEGKFSGIEILGDIELSGDASENIEKITVAEKASLTIDSKKVKDVEIENNGTLTIGANTKHLKSASKIENNNTMLIETDAIVAAAIINNAELELEDEAEASAVANAEDGEIVLGEDAVLNLTSNAGLVTTEDGAKVTGSNANGKIEYIEGAKVASNVGGVVYRKVSGDEEAEPTGTAATNVNTWYVVGDLTLDANVKITNIEVMGDYDIEVEVPATGTAPVLEITGELIINGSTTTEGNIKAAKVTVNKEGVWTNDGNVEITAVNAISNEKGEIENNGRITLPVGSTPDEANGKTATFGEWDGAAAEITEAASTTIIEELVSTYWGAAKQGGWLTETEYMSQNPYNVDAYVNVMSAWIGQNNAQGQFMTKLCNSSNWNLNEPTKDELKAKLVANYTSFVAAVDKYVFAAEGITASTTTTNPTLAEYVAEYIDVKGGHILKGVNTADFVQNKNLFNNSDAAMRDLLAKMVIAKNGAAATIAGYKTNLQIYKNITTAAVKTALEKTTCGSGTATFEGAYAYIWVDCALDKAVKVAEDYAAFSGINSWGQNAPAKFVEWATDVYAAGTQTNIISAFATAGVTETNILNYGKYSADQYSAVAGDE